MNHLSDVLGFSDLLNILVFQVRASMTSELCTKVNSVLGNVQGVDIGDQTDRNLANPSSDEADAAQDRPGNSFNLVVFI